MSGAWPSLAP